MGYYDDRKHPVRTSMRAPKLEAPITVLRFTTEVWKRPAAEQRNVRRELQRTHTADVARGKGGWLTQRGGRGRFLVHLSEYARLHAEEIAGGQEESLEERVQRLERQVAEIRPLRVRVKSLETQVDALAEALEILLRRLKTESAPDRMRNNDSEVKRTKKQR